jgi:Immunoglobulin domain
MRINTPLITDSSRLAAEQNASNYSVGVANHINGDWAQHIQIQIINKNWVDSGGNTIPGSSRLRILATDGSQDVALVIPIIPFTPPGGSGSGPQITAQPTNQSVIVGGSITFKITATGSAPLTYQWRYAKAVINGATSSQYVITNAQTSNAGNYDCVVSNNFGTVTSNEASLVVNPAK